MGNMNKFIISKVLVLVVAVVYVVALPALPSEPDDSWYGNPEIQCLKRGGFCIKKDQCEDWLGWPIYQFCPQQFRAGYQCCGILYAKDDTRCRMRRGKCEAKGSCKPSTLYSNATDCPPDQDCCLPVTPVTDTGDSFDDQ